MRVFCDHATNPVMTVGQGKPGLGGVVPTLQVTGWPAVCNEMFLLLADAAPAVPAVIAVGVPGQTTLPQLGTL